MSSDTTGNTAPPGRTDSQATGAVASGTPAPTLAPDDAGSPSPREYVRILLIAAVLGIPAALLAALLMSLIQGLTLLMWTTIPEAFKWSSPASWYVIAVPAIGGLLVAAVLRLPGHGGEAPSAGMALDALSPVQAMSALLAALISLGFGIVLGPEVPLIVLGTTTGLLASRLVQPGSSGVQMLVIAGAFATISTLFGGPLVSALMLLEIMAFSGRVPSKSLIPALMPGFVASGTAALVFTGIDRWPGVHLNALALPPLPNYPTVRLDDVAWCIVVALVVAVVVALARTAGRKEALRVVSVSPFLVLCVAGFAVGLSAVIFRDVTGQPVNLVLFSGESALSPIIAETSAGVLLLLIICKGAGYILSLGSGFRGGPTFPACALGVTFGVMASIVIPGLDLTPAVIAGLAAGAAAVLDLGIFGALLAAFLAGAAITSETIPIAVMASVIGWLVATSVKSRQSASEPQSPSR